MSSTPNGHVVRFEIPGFGVTQLRPDDLQDALFETHGKSPTGIVLELREMGWDLAVMANDVSELSRIEWVAIYGECTGKGMD